MVQGVHKGVIRSSFGVIRRHEVSKVLDVSPSVRPTATKDELRLMEVTSR